MKTNTARLPHLTLLTGLLARALFSPLQAAPVPNSVTIDAGPFERHEITVALPPLAPSDRAPRPIALARMRAGQAFQGFPLQFMSDGRAVVTIDHLAKGSRERFQLVTNAPPALVRAPRISAERQGTRLNFVRVANANGLDPAPRQPLFSYQAEPAELPRADGENGQCFASPL